MNRLEEIRQRAAEATPGPWNNSVGGSEYVDNDEGFKVCLTRRSRDADFIAHAREDIPWLLGRDATAQVSTRQLKARVKELKARVKELEEQLVAVVSQLESFTGCQACKSAIDAETCSDKSCMYGEKWVWRGPKED